MIQKIGNFVTVILSSATLLAWAAIGGSVIKVLVSDQ